MTNPTDQTLTNPLALTVAGIPFSSPVLNASGAFNAPLFNSLAQLNKTLGGIITKTVTPLPQAGNPQPRTVELPGIGMLNSIGLQNPGIEECLNHEIPALNSYGLPLIVSISAHSSAQFAQMAEIILTHPHGDSIDALELNLSCPNVEAGGVHFGSSAHAVQETLQAVTALFKKPIFAKLTPNVGDIAAIGGAALEGGASGLTAINTVLGVAIDVQRKKPVLPRVSAGYSGPGIKPIALHAIWTLHRHFPEVPLMAVGGISDTHDILEFIMAGASLVQIGTMAFRNPLIFKKSVDELQKYCHQEGLMDLSSLRGCAHL